MAQDALQQEPSAQVVKDVDQPGYRYARALYEYARSSAEPFTSTFRKNRAFRLGTDGHYRFPGSAAAIIADQWTCKAIDNMLFATVDNKLAVIGKGQLSIHIEDLEDSTSYYQRLLIAETIRHQMELLHWRRIRDDLFLQGSDTGIGVVMVSVKPDALTGAMRIEASVLKSDEFAVDPDVDNLPDAKSACWYPTLSGATLRGMWPSKASKIKPDYQQASGGGPDGMTYKPTRNDDNLIYGGAHEFIIDTQSSLKVARAKTCFVFIKETDAIVEELRETVLREATPGYRCIDCGKYVEPQDVPPDSTDCPYCGGALTEATIPAKVQSDKIVRRAYPYGRLIAYSGDVLLFDGENPNDIETVYPFSVYHHYRVPGVFYGWNDVALLRTVQDVIDTTIRQGVDYVRMAVNGVFEYPLQAKAYTELGNAPGQKVPVPAQFSNLAHWVTSAGAFNTQAWQAVRLAAEKSFQVTSGLTDLVAGFVGSPPPSGVAIEATTTATGNRIGNHVRNMEDCMSSFAQNVYALMHQHLDQPFQIMARMPDSELKSIMVEMSQLPKNVRVRVSISTEEILKDQNIGQNLAKLLDSPALAQANPALVKTLSDPEIILPALGVPPNRVRELSDRVHLEAEINPPIGTAPPMAGPPQIPMIPGGQ